MSEEKIDENFELTEEQKRRVWLKAKFADLVACTTTERAIQTEQSIINKFEALAAERDRLAELQRWIPVEQWPVIAYQEVKMLLKNGVQTTGFYGSGANAFWHARGFRDEPALMDGPIFIAPLPPPPSEVKQ